LARVFVRARSKGICHALQPSQRRTRPGYPRDWLYITGEIDESDPPRLSLQRLTGLRWNCNDVMPGDVRESISELVSVLGHDDQPIFSGAGVPLG
jgi:hypothetical protein